MTDFLKALPAWCRARWRCRCWSIEVQIPALMGAAVLACLLPVVAAAAWLPDLARSQTASAGEALAQQTAYAARDLVAGRDWPGLYILLGQVTGTGLVVRASLMDTQERQLAVATASDYDASRAGVRLSSAVSYQKVRLGTLVLELDPAFFLRPLWSVLALVVALVCLAGITAVSLGWCYAARRRQQLVRALSRLRALGGHERAWHSSVRDEVVQLVQQVDRLSGSPVSPETATASCPPPERPDAHLH